MATNNSVNDKDPNFVVYDGAGTYFGRTLTAGTGISISNGTGQGGNPVITNTAPSTPPFGGLGLNWNVITANSSFTLAVNNGYLINGPSGKNFTLPTTAAVNDVIWVQMYTPAPGAISNHLVINSGQNVLWPSTGIPDPNLSQSVINNRPGPDFIGLDNQATIVLVCTTANTTFYAILVTCANHVT